MALSLDLKCERYGSMQMWQYGGGQEDMEVWDYE